MRKVYELGYRLRRKSNFAIVVDVSVEICETIFVATDLKEVKKSIWADAVSVCVSTEQVRDTKIAIAANWKADEIRRFDFTEKLSDGFSYNDGTTVGHVQKSIYQRRTKDTLYFSLHYIFHTIFISTD